MAYIPPHMRRRNGTSAVPTPKPFHQNSNNPKNPPTRIVYSPGALCRWYHTFPKTGNLFLMPYNGEPVGAKPRWLKVIREPVPAKEDEKRVLDEIIEKVYKDLIETSKHARGERESVRLAVVATIGKILFHENSCNCLDSIRSAIRKEDMNQHFCKSFYTTVTDQYMRDIEEFLVEKSGFDIECSKEKYHVKVVDNDQPDITMHCKCTVSSDGNLELCKIERNQLRYMVTDISCASKDFDLRLMLNPKRILLNNLNIHVKEGIDKLIQGAVRDPEVKGGLRWPFTLGTASFSGRLHVVGVWHIKYKTLRKEQIRVSLRTADRFELTSSRGEVSNEVSFKLVGVSELLTEGKMEENNIMEMIRDLIDLVWENCLGNRNINV